MSGVGQEVKTLVHLQNVIFWVKFSRSSYLITNYQKAFILVPNVAFTSFHGTPGSVPGVGSEVKI